MATRGSKRKVVDSLLPALDRRSVDRSKTVNAPILDAAVARLLQPIDMDDHPTKFSDDASKPVLIEGLPASGALLTWNAMRRTTAAQWADAISRNCGAEATEHESMVPAIHNIFCSAALGEALPDVSGTCAYIEYRGGDAHAAISMDFSFRREWLCTITKIIVVPSATMAAEKQLSRELAAQGKGKTVHFSTSKTLQRMLSRLRLLEKPMTVQIEDARCVMRHKKMYESAGFVFDRKAETYQYKLE